MISAHAGYKGHCRSVRKLRFRKCGNEKSEECCHRSVAPTASPRGPTSGAVSCPAPPSWVLGGRHGWASAPAAGQRRAAAAAAAPWSSRDTGAESSMGRRWHPGRRRRRRIITRGRRSAHRWCSRRRTCDRYSKRSRCHVRGRNRRSPTTDRKY